VSKIFERYHGQSCEMSHNRSFGYSCAQYWIAQQVHFDIVFSMVKFFKRTLYVILGIIALGAAWLYVELNSEKFATDMVYLECTIDEVSDLDQRNRRKVIHGRLREDWINDKVLLNWVADGGDAEDGLERTKKLSVRTDYYIGYDYKDKVRRTFNRDTLEYSWELERSSADEIADWYTRKCVISEKRVFQAERKKSAAATKAKQKI
jgi:hypothetical protein